MTLPRSERNVKDVLYQLACDYPGGLEALAQRMGSKAQHLRNRMGPQIASEPSLRDLSLTIEYSQEAGKKNALDPLHALCWQHRGIFVPLDELGEVSDECILKATAHVMQHLGEVTSAVSEALEDNHITDREADQIESRVRRVIAATCSLFARIKGRARKDAGKRPFFGLRRKQEPSHQ
jgi:hypothetical protein